MRFSFGGPAVLATAGLLIITAAVGCASPDRKAQELNAQANKAWARVDALSEQSTKLVEKQNKLYSTHRPSQWGEAFLKQMAALDRQIVAKMRVQSKEESSVAALLRKSRAAAVSDEMKKYVDMELGAIAALQKSTALGIKMTMARPESIPESKAPSAPDIDPSMSEAEMNAALRASDKEMQEWIDKQDAALTAQTDVLSESVQQWMEAMDRYMELRSKAQSYGVEHGLSD